MLGLKLDLLVSAPIATLYAAIIAIIVGKHKINEVMESIINSAKEMQLVFFILMLAYAMAEIFMLSGVGASIISIALKVGLTGRSIAVFGIMITSLVSIATGSSWGTFAACAPIFMWLNHIVGGNIALTLGAIAGGACFGDNIGLISDTTIVSSGIQKVEVVKRMRHQGGWSLTVLVLSIIIFYFMGIYLGLPTEVKDATVAIGNIPQDVWKILSEKRASAVQLLNQVKNGVPVYMCIPLILVLISAFRGMSTIICLLIGIISACILGIPAGTITNMMDILKVIEGKFAEAGGSLIVMMMWIIAFGGVMKLMDAFKPLAKIIIKLSYNVKSLMFWNGILSLLGNAALADEMAQIVTIGPVIKDIVDKNVETSDRNMEILRLRNATFSDALGVFGSQLIPWHGYIVYYLGIVGSVYPLYSFKVSDIVKYNFLAIIAVVSILVLTLTGMDKLIPRFSLPKESEMRLKKN